MAETTETLTIEYDSTNDVLRVLAMPFDENPIAVPRGEDTVLVSDSLDRVVGLVLSSYLPRIRGSMAAGSAMPDDELIQVSTAILENVFPALTQQVGPSAKDAIALWLERLERPPA